MWRGRGVGGGVMDQPSFYWIKARLPLLSSSAIHVHVHIIIFRALCVASIVCTAALHVQPVAVDCGLC